MSESELEGTYQRQLTVSNAFQKLCLEDNQRNRAVAAEKKGFTLFVFLYAMLMLPGDHHVLRSPQLD